MAELQPDRLSALRQERNLSQAALAREIGVGQSTIVRLEAGGTRNPREILALAKALRCSPEYLLGQSDERGWSSLGEEQLPFKGAANIEAAHGPINDDLVEIDQIDLRFGLGGTFLDNPVEIEKMTFSRAWLRRLTNAPPHLLTWTTGDGDSMEPTIRDGEIILIDRSQTTPIMGDQIWAFAFGEIGMVKRLRPRPDGTVDIHSDNQYVRPDRATDGELHVIGRVIAVVKRL